MEIGKLILFIGPMFSRKTTKLITELGTYADIGYKTIYINHNCDVRVTEASSNDVSTHSSQFKSLSSKVKSIKASRLSDIDVNNYDVIGIDEAQFFDDLVENVVDWIDNKNKVVLIASLDGDIRKNTFGHTLKLIPYSDEVFKLAAYCKLCTDKLVNAPFTARLSTSDEQVLVGGADLYIPLCRKCHKNFTPSSQPIKP